MVTNFEQHTADLTPVEEQQILPILITGFKNHTKADPIKAPAIIKQINEHFKAKGIKYNMNDSKLRKYCNHIRCFGLLPLIATSNGYYISYDKAEIEKQISSLEERARSIANCAKGLKEFLNK